MTQTQAKPHYEALADRFYVPILAQYAWHPALYFLLVPTILMTLFVAYMKWKTKKNEEEEISDEAIASTNDLLTKHFVGNLNNLENGRVWTLITSALTLNGRIDDLSVICSVLFLYGGNVFLSLRAPLFLALYFGTHGFVSLINYTFSGLQLARVRSAKASIQSHEDLSYSMFASMSYPNFIKMERTKLLDITPTLNESRRKAIEEMTDEQVLNEAERRYSYRPSVSSSAFLSLAVFFTLVNPYAKFPTKKWLIPVFPATVLLAFYESVKTNSDYAIPEIVFFSISQCMLPFFLWIITRGSIQPMKMSLNPVNVASKVPEAIRKDAATIQSEKQIEAMKRRNEKFRAKNK